MPQPKNIYLRLTDEFNSAGLRAIICSGQAVVLHKLAVMSKDGDWILREDDDSLAHVLSVLARHSAEYRFGAPLDIRWHSGGWSSHFEFQDAFRVRADFFTRPPRISPTDLQRIWAEQKHRQPPYLDPPALAQMKQTNREKDYAVIGELARIMSNPLDQLLHSRSPRDIIEIASANPDIVRVAAMERPLLNAIASGEDEIARLIDEERRLLIRRNEARLQRHASAAQQWKALWPEVSRKIHGAPLNEAHELIVEAALNTLPFHVEEPDHE